MFFDDDQDVEELGCRRTCCGGVQLLTAGATDRDAGSACRLGNALEAARSRPFTARSPGGCWGRRARGAGPRSRSRPHRECATRWWLDCDFGDRSSFFVKCHHEWPAPRKKSSHRAHRRSSSGRFPLLRARHEDCQYTARYSCLSLSAVTFRMCPIHNSGSRARKRAPPGLWTARVLSAKYYP